MNKEKELECLRCTYKWIPITDNPKVCPRCKSFQWNMSRIRKKQKTVWDEKK
jgi:rubrerythrin